MNFDLTTIYEALDNGKSVDDIKREFDQTMMVALRKRQRDKVEQEYLEALVTAWCSLVDLYASDLSLQTRKSELYYTKEEWRNIANNTIDEVRERNSHNIRGKNNNDYATGGTSFDDVIKSFLKENNIQ